MTKKFLAWSLLVGLVTIVVVAGYASKAPAATKELKIGVACALTGPGTAWGVPFRDAIMLLDGTTIDVAGEKYQVKFIVEDNKYTSKDAVTATNKLIFVDKVKFITQFGTACVLAALPITEENKVLMAGVATVPGTTPLGVKYSFRLTLCSTELVPVIYKWLNDNRPELRRYALLAINVEHGKAAQKMAAEQVKKHGRELVYSELYEPGVTDFYPHLTKIIAAKPDGLDLCVSLPGQAALIVKQARELGFKGQIFNPVCIDGAELLKVAGKDAAEGYIFICSPCGSTMIDPVCSPLEKDVYKRFVDRYGYFKIGMGFWWDHVKVILEGIEKAGSLDVDKVAKALETEELELSFGRSRFGIEKYYGHQLLAAMYMVRIRDGKQETFKRIEYKEWMKILGVK